MLFSEQSDSGWLRHTRAWTRLPYMFLGIHDGNSAIKSAGADHYASVAIACPRGTPHYRNGDKLQQCGPVLPSFASFTNLLCCSVDNFTYSNQLSGCHHLIIINFRKVSHKKYILSLVYIQHMTISCKESCFFHFCVSSKSPEKFQDKVKIQVNS